MLPTTHLLAGAVCGTLGMRQGLLSPAMAAGTAAAAVLIDLDHWAAFFLKKRSVNLLRAWNSSIDRDGDSVRTVIHEPQGVMVISVLLGLLWLYIRPAGFMLGSAYLSHIFLDYLPDRRSWAIPFRLGSMRVRTTPLEILFTLIMCGILAALW